MGFNHSLSATLSNENIVDSIIKTVQTKLKFKERGKPGVKTWKAFYRLMIGNEPTATQKSDVRLDTHNELAVAKMSLELAQFAEELIFLSKEQGITVRLLNDNNLSKGRTVSIHSFGLTFDIGIFDQTSSGELIYNGNILLYANVAKLAESIGLTWAANQKTYTNQSRFELRPAWSLRMNEKEMLKELQRRKQANLSFLARLD